jgi:hypothetical protein
MASLAATSALDDVLPLPRLLELDHVDLAASPDTVWQAIRHQNLASSPWIRALFELRTLPNELRGEKVETASIRIDDFVSTPEHPGFRVLIDRPPHEVVIGAIGKVWRPDIPFVHVPDAEAYRSFSEPGYVKVAWALRVLARGDGARLEIEVRVEPTDEGSWRKFRPYFRFIGPFSHFIRRSTLASLAADLGTPEARENERPFPSDALLPDATDQITHAIDVAARPEAIWPWLVQMGCRRAGFYSYDVLDNGGVRSAREIHPELLEVHVGQVLPATRESDEGFEVLRADAPRALVLGGLWDVEAERQRPFGSPRPAKFWHVTWAFELEPLDERSTRLYARVRGAFSPDGRFHSLWIRPVHDFMQSKQLENLAARVEGRLARDDWHDVIEGIAGAGVMALSFLTPFLASARAHWGVDAATAARPLPGDDLVPDPRWQWTHGIVIDAPPEKVWPWVAQIGADRGGFYSYQWLENVAGCEVSNAEVVHPEWEVRPGMGLSLHPKMPPLTIAGLERGRWFVARAPRDRAAEAAGAPWVDASWLFYLEPSGEGRTRFLSRYRVATSDDLATRMKFGHATIEPIGFAMDRRMLLGVKERAERVAG